MQHLERAGLARFDGTQQRFIARGVLRDAALADRDAAPVRNDPPVTVERAGTRRSRPALDDAEKVAAQIRAGL